MTKKKILINKYKMYLDHIIFYQKLNGMEVNPYGNARFLKFVIGKGNNSLLARIALKTRWWWAEIKMKDFNFNFIWTQWKSNKVTNHLPKYNSESKEFKTVNIRDDTTKNSDTDDAGSLNQSTSETIITTSAKVMKVSPDNIETKLLGTPEPRVQNKKKDKVKNSDSPIIEPMETESSIIWNHVEGHVQLSNKKGLFYNMKNYYESIGEDPFVYLPLTFHITENLEDKEFEKFTEEFKKYEQEDKDKIEQVAKDKKIKPKPKNIWIIKPGENTNRGSGINVWNTMEQIKNIVKRYFLITIYLSQLKLTLK